MRSLYAIGLLLAGCVGSSAPEQASDFDDSGDDEGGGEGAPVECMEAVDCVAAASTCCECPSFAVTAASNYDDACAEVDCEPADSCSQVQAACVAGLCQLVCLPVVTDMVCEVGFASDELGCLIDECGSAPPDGDGDPAPECGGDEDCVQVPADCCGCASGGEDTAVPASEEEEHLAGLDCRTDPACPDVDVCDPEAAPRCISGSCQLVADAPDEPDPGDGVSAPECGTAGSPSCPSGQVCVLNHPDAGSATARGVGTCHDL